jgi:hypothetical protein
MPKLPVGLCRRPARPASRADTVFPIAGPLLALAMLYGVARREFRDFRG